MSQKNTGGPAFPFAFSEEDRVSDGMTLRDHFAGLAMQAWVNGMINTAADANIDSPRTVADFAYQMADAMLKERKS